MTRTVAAHELAFRTQREVFEQELAKRDEVIAGLATRIDELAARLSREDADPPSSEVEDTSNLPTSPVSPATVRLESTAIAALSKADEDLLDEPSDDDAFNISALVVLRGGRPVETVWQ